MKHRRPTGREYAMKQYKIRRANTALAIVCVVFVSVFFMGAVSQFDLTTQVKGILPIVNGGTNTSSTLTGIVRGGSSYTAAELSGDATTSGSNAVTVAKVNGTSIPTNASADQALITSGSAAGAWVSIPNCTGACVLQYSTSTHTFSTATALTGSFADAETPTGTIDGSNATFTLAHTPSASTLQLYKNGQQMIAGASSDYTLSTATVTFATGAKPKTGDVLIAFYRY